MDLYRAATCIWEKCPGGTLLEGGHNYFEEVRYSPNPCDQPSLTALSGTESRSSMLT